MAMNKQTKQMRPPAILLCGHGSRDPDAAKEFKAVVAKIMNHFAPISVSGAFLSYNEPSIPQELQTLYDQGFREIIVQPVTLYHASHSKGDIPVLLADFKQHHPDIMLHYGSSLGLMPQVIEATAQSVASVMEGIDPEECKLLIVGRGSKDRMISDQTLKLCQKLHNRLGLGDSRYCYNSISAPHIKDALSQAAHSHYHHIIIMPFLLFSGRLLSNIHGEIEQAAQKYPHFTFLKAPHLGPFDITAEALISKITPSLNSTS